MKKAFWFTVFMLCFIFCYGQKDIISVDYEKHPQFPGGEAEMNKFIYENLIYPQSALEKQVEGKVMVRFLVRKTGELDSIKVIKGIDEDCDALAINIVRKMPKWEPGGMAGDLSKTDIWVTLPIVFKLPNKYIDGERIYMRPEQLPRFPGGEDELYKFINSHKKYPVIDCGGHPHEQGRIIIRFTVTKDGKIKNPEILRSKMSNYFDQEALRVINIMPDWEPAKHDGKLVNSFYVLPIVFRFPY